MSVNSLKWIYLGDFIEQRREKYSDIELLPIRGVSKDGFIPPKQNLEIRIKRKIAFVILIITP